MDDTKNNCRIRQQNHRNRKQINALAMTEDIFDDESHGVCIDISVKKNKEMLEPTIIERFVEK